MSSDDISVSIINGFFTEITSIRLIIKKINYFIFKNFLNFYLCKLNEY